MLDHVRGRFDAGAGDWTRYNQEPLGCIRRELTWRNLAPYLPDVRDGEDAPCALDAGGGSGEMALRLATYGCRVWLLDYAPAMLEQARQASADLPEEARARLSFCQLSAGEVAEAFAPGTFDVVVCHTLIEYLPDPVQVLRGLASLLRDDGLLSLSFVNRHSEVLRQVWSRGDPDGALAKLKDGAFHAKLFDVPGQSYSAEEVSAWLPPLALSIKATRGVRIFADRVPPQHLTAPAFLEALLKLESAAAGLEPYRHIARYIQLLARKDREPT
jgi:2-polyprenyl-3-methyl-5-hydroxy-6-metoxy-1,4-benzoquinol methylase